MNGFYHCPIISRRGCGFDMSDQMGSVVIAGLCEMDLLPSPENSALYTKAGIYIVGRVDQQGTRGKVFLDSPLDWSFWCVILLYPHADASV
jgi:hypothetical protein